MPKLEGVPCTVQGYLLVSIQTGLLSAVYDPLGSWPGLKLSALHPGRPSPKHEAFAKSLRQNPGS